MTQAETTPAARARTGPSWRLTALLAALTAFGPMSLDLYLPAFPDIARDFDVSTGQVQWTFSAALVGLGVGQLFWGPLADRYGRRRPLLVGMAVYAVASLLIALAPSLPVMIGLRVVQAAGGAAGIVLARAILRDLFHGRALAQALGTVMLVFMLAPVLAPILGWGVMTLAQWQWMFLLLALFSAVCLAGVLAMPESLPPERRSTYGLPGALREFGQIARHRGFQRFGAVSALGSVALFAYISFSPRVLMDTYGVPGWGFATIFGGLGVGITLGGEVNRRLLFHHPPARVLRWALSVQLIGALGVLLAALAHAPLVLFLPLVALPVATVIPVNSNALALSLDPFPHAAATAAAFVGGLQQVLAGLVAAALAALTLAPAVAMAAGMVGASVLGLGLSVVRRPRRAQRPTESANIGG